MRPPELDATSLSGHAPHDVDVLGLRRAPALAAAQVLPCMVDPEERDAGGLQEAPGVAVHRPDGVGAVLLAGDGPRDRVDHDEVSAVHPDELERSGATLD